MNDTEGFVVRTGHEPPGALAADRDRQVASAWESLQRIRHLVQPQTPDLPAPWERAQPVRAVALALEAAGIPFCTVDDAGVVAGSGVQLQPEGDDRVRVTCCYARGERPVDAGEADLGAAREALGNAGWDALLYRAGRNRFLVVEPGRTR
jgi:hypothetical protein